MNDNDTNIRSEELETETVDQILIEPVVETVPDPTLPQRRPRKVSLSAFGPFEWGILGAGLLALLAVAALYLFVVVPADRELAKNRTETDRLDAELASAKAKYGDITSTTAQVAKLVQSVDDFETRFLPPASNGRTAIYQRLNGLIVAYGLTNTTGPDYQPLEALAIGERKADNDSEKGREKFRSLFPGVYVTMTVEGPYQNLRRFIREVETGNEFVIISSVELAPSDNEQEKDALKQQAAQAASAQPGAMTGQPLTMDQFKSGMSAPPAAPIQSSAKRQGKSHGEVVALRMEMATYFRRPDFSPTMQTAGSAQ